MIEQKKIYFKCIKYVFLENILRLDSDTDFNALIRIVSFWSIMHNEKICKILIKTSN